MSVHRRLLHAGAVRRATQKERRRRAMQEARARNTLYPRRDGRLVGETGEWEVIVGMEMHAQIATTHKLFSGAPLRGHSLCAVSRAVVEVRAHLLAARRIATLHF